MNSIKEKEVLREWVTKNTLIGTENSFGCKKADSYWHKREVSAGIEEYGFDTIPELKEQLVDLWDKEPELQEKGLVLSVAAFKSRTERNSEIVSIPEYVYIF